MDSAVGRPVPADLKFIAIGLASGLLSGLLGIGGGIVIVPILVIWARFTQKSAQATSLAAICLTALSGSVAYVLAGHVALVPAALVVAGGLVGSAIGAALASRTPDHLLRFVFAGVMIAVAVRLALGTGAPDAATDPASSVAAMVGYVVLGVGMGTLSALIGVGGGVVLVPALVLGFGFAAELAQGTSLLVMIPIALAGALRLARYGHTAWRPGLGLGLGGMLGAPLGAVAAFALSGEVLHRLFAALLVFVSVQLLLRGRSGRAGGSGGAGPETGDPT